MKAVWWRSVAIGLGIWSSIASAAEVDCIIEPGRTIDIRAPVEGLITTVNVDRGDKVQVGSVLVELDAGYERATAEAARFRATTRGPIQSAESRLQYAVVKARRSDQLASNKYASAQERDEAAAEKSMAEAQLLEAKENRQLAELEYARALEQVRLRTVRSPIDAVVVDRLMHPGEFADSGDLRRPILKLADLATLHVEALMPLAAWGRVQEGQEVEVLPEAPVGGRYVATLKTADRVLDAASRTFGVRLELPNPDLRLPAGIRCRAVFEGIP